MSKFSRVLWLIFGIALIISGIIAIFNPLETVVMLAYIIGFLMIFSGISSIFYFVSLRHLIGSGIILLDGIVSTICGIIIISNLLISAATIPYFVAICYFKPFSCRPHNHIRRIFFIIYCNRCSMLQFIPHATRNTKFFRLLYIKLAYSWNTNRIPITYNSMINPECIYLISAY